MSFDSAMATSGEYIRNLREKRGLSQPKLSAKAGMSVRTLQRAEKNDPSITRYAIKDIVEALESTLEDYDAATATPAAPDEQQPAGGQAETYKVPEGAAFKAMRPTAGIDPDTFLAVSHIPEYSADVAACRWIPCDTITALTTGEQARIVDRGEFIVRITGDCMEPTYHDGGKYQFRIVRLDREAWPVGSDCLIFSSDHEVTFKRMHWIDDDKVTLYALNKTKYPDAMPIARQMVSRVAVVVQEIRPVKMPAFKPVKVTGE